MFVLNVKDLNFYVLVDPSGVLVINTCKKQLNEDNQNTQNFQSLSTITYYLNK